MKLLTIIGARPQFVKAAVLSRYIKQENDITEILVHTGQHYDNNMSELFFEQMQIPKPDFNLGLGGKSHGEMTGEMIIGIEKLLLEHKPDYIVIYGDTNSTLAGAIAASKLHIPVVHIEAGLRSYDRNMPEEINRVISDTISNYLFCPTQSAIENLEKEGIRKSSNVRVINCGDIMYEAFEYYKKNISNIDLDYKYISHKNYIHDKDIYDIINKSDFNLMTLHRDFNVDYKDKLIEIFEGIKLAEINTILPLHPRTKARIEKFNLWSIIPKNLFLIEPIGYYEMLNLELNCQMIVTDSGGVQKEAFFAKKPCITLRDSTEWTELVDIGVNKLTRINRKEIKKNIINKNFKTDSFEQKPYGKGNTAEIIIKNIKR